MGANANGDNGRRASEGVTATGKGSLLEESSLPAAGTEQDRQSAGEVCSSTAAGEERSAITTTTTASGGQWRGGGVGGEIVEGAMAVTLNGVGRGGALDPSCAGGEQPAITVNAPRRYIAMGGQFC